MNDLTKDFYQTLPFDFGVRRPALIDHLIRVKEKAKMLEVINDICIAEKCLLNSMHDLKQTNPRQTLKNELLTHVEHVSRDDKIFSLIYDAI